jgi:hypothetical protein
MNGEHIMAIQTTSDMNVYPLSHGWERAMGLNGASNRIYRKTSHRSSSVKRSAHPCMGENAAPNVIIVIKSQSVFDRDSNE